MIARRLARVGQSAFGASRSLIIRGYASHVRLYLWPSWGTSCGKVPIRFVIPAGSARSVGANRAFGTPCPRTESGCPEWEPASVSFGLPRRTRGAGSGPALCGQLAAMEGSDRMVYPIRAVLAAAARMREAVRAGEASSAAVIIAASRATRPAPAGAVSLVRR